jgi:hypothetical protein
MSDLDQAMKLVAAAQDQIDIEQYPELWRLLNHAWAEIDGIPELTTALEAGLLTEYRAGEIARLADPLAQQSALKIWTERSLVRTQAQASAAAALRGYLANSSRVDLSEVCSIIRAAVRSGSKLALLA